MGLAGVKDAGIGAPQHPHAPLLGLAPARAFQVLRPGDELVALPYLDPKGFQIGANLLGLIYQVAAATRIFL